MNKIFKYELEIVDTQNLVLPKDAKILCAQYQRKILCLWAMVKPDNPMQKRIIRIIGTGHEIPEKDLTYIDTVQSFDGQLVLHIFEDENV